jgi:hypothetical protein
MGKELVVTVAAAAAAATATTTTKTTKTTTTTTKAAAEVVVATPIIIIVPSIHVDVILLVVAIFSLVFLEALLSSSSGTARWHLFLPKIKKYFNLD